MKETSKRGKPFRNPERKLRDDFFAIWIGKKVKEARKASGLSPQDFAKDRLGISIHAYHKLTSGASSVSESRAAEIFRKIGLQWEVFAGGEKFIYPNE